MSDGERKNPEQIPGKERMGQTTAMESEQGGISSERKEVDVKDYPKAAAVGQILKDLEFPADKSKIIEYAKRESKASERRNTIRLAKNRRKTIQKCFRCYKGGRDYKG